MSQDNIEPDKSEISPRLWNKAINLEGFAKKKERKLIDEIRARNTLMKNIMKMGNIDGKVNVNYKKKQERMSRNKNDINEINNNDNDF